MLLYGTGHGTFRLGGYLTAGSQPSAIVYGAVLSPGNYDPFQSMVVANKGSADVVQIEADYFGESSATLANVSKLGTGTYHVVANYSGGGDWDPASSNTVTLTSYLQSATALTLSASTVTAATHVTLTGRVTANGHPVTSGVVRFCNAAAASCVGSAWYGTASLNGSGVATLTRTFAAGTYHIDGRFPATSTDTKSTSAAKTLIVNP